MNKITVGLIDDHHMVREGLRALLAMEQDLEVVGEAANTADGLSMVRRARPKVAIIDVLMHGLSGLELARQVSEQLPGTSILMLSMTGGEAYVHQALRNGAAGYVLKDSAVTVLTAAIREVAAGRRYLSAPLSERSFESYLETADSLETDYDTLTDREREIFQLAAEGHNNVGIANQLTISPRTVEIHRLNMMRKLKLRNQTELVRYALRRGVISLHA
jgi:two-component system, NarL family, response regulator NreC